MKKYIYGAYGSNLNHDQMFKRCPKARLDRYEGFPYLYERTILNVVKPNRKIVRAIVYYMLRDNYEPPSESYLLSIKEGYEHCGIPVDRLINAVEQMGEVYYG